VSEQTHKRNLRFFVPCIPPKATSQQKGIMMIGGKPRHFKKAHVREAEDTITSLFAEHRPDMPFQGAVKLTVYWTYPWRKSEPKKNRAGGRKWCDTRPDCSNIVKMVEDCLTRLNFWNDDSQVAALHVEKGWGDAPGIGIRIEEL